jgi:hypothetical protein
MPTRVEEPEEAPAEGEEAAEGEQPEGDAEGTAEAAEGESGADEG